MIEFEWDEAKNLANQKKHGISFEVAAHFLVSKKSIVIPSVRGEESRFKAVVAMENGAFAVVFTYRTGKIRLISVRRASREERKENSTLLGR